MERARDGFDTPAYQAQRRGSQIDGFGSGLQWVGQVLPIITEAQFALGHARQHLAHESPLLHRRRAARFLGFLARELASYPLRDQSNDVFVEVGKRLSVRRRREKGQRSPRGLVDPNDGSEVGFTTEFLVRDARTPPRAYTGIVNRQGRRVRRQQDGFGTKRLVQGTTKARGQGNAFRLGLNDGVHPTVAVDTRENAAVESQPPMPRSQQAIYLPREIYIRSGGNLVERADAPLPLHDRHFRKEQRLLGVTLLGDIGIRAAPELDIPLRVMSRKGARQEPVEFAIDAPQWKGIFPRLAGFGHARQTSWSRHRGTRRGELSASPSPASHPGSYPYTQTSVGCTRRCTPSNPPSMPVAPCCRRAYETAAPNGADSRAFLLRRL